jgi:hypothetical protein
VALDSRDGKPKWTWSGPTLNAWHMGLGGPGQGDAVLGLEFRRSAPRLLSLARGKFVCAAVLEGEEVWAPQGVRGPGRYVRPQLVLALFDGAGKICQRRVPVKMVSRNFIFRTQDLDGDGEDDVLFFDNGKLIATHNGLEQVLWEWPLPGPGADLIEVRPAGKQHAATVVVNVGSVVYGIDGRTGRPRWRCEGTGRPVALLPTGDAHDLPAILFHLANQQNEVQATVCRLGQPVDAAGAYQSGGAALADDGTDDDSQLARCLPWVGELDRLRSRAGWPMMLRPAQLPWTIGFLLVLAVAAVLLVGAVRQRSWRRGLLVVVLAGSVCTVGWIKFGGPDFEALVTVPLFVFLGALGVWMVRRRWLRVGVLLIGSLALSALLGVLWLRLDARTLEPWEHHSPDGWYAAWVLGAYVCGGMLLVAWLARVALRWRRTA